MTIQDIVEYAQRQYNINLLNIQLQHIYTLATLPRYHNDPFDRLLISQAITEKLIFVSKDQHTRLYPVNYYW